jgi:RNA polymerase sigma-70 factor (ECF subfamily)
LRQPSDEELMIDVKDGDIAAFEQLVDRYKTPVYSLAYGMLRSREDAEEAAQDTFVKLFKSRGMFDDGRRLEPWLFRIAGNTCRDLLRRRHAERIPRSTSMSPELAEIVPDPRGDGRDPLEAGRLAVRHELGKLSDKLRLPLVLKYVNGLTNRQVADVLGISVSNVKVRMARAKDLLQSRLHPNAEDRDPAEGEALGGGSDFEFEALPARGAHGKTARTPRARPGAGGRSELGTTERDRAGDAAEEMS